MARKVSGNRYTVPVDDYVDNKRPCDPLSQWMKALSLELINSEPSLSAPRSPICKERSQVVGGLQSPTKSIKLS